MVKPVDKVVRIFFFIYSLIFLTKPLALLFMYQTNSPTTIQKALKWLNKQDLNWSKHIKDNNTAVKMYLKSQQTQKAPSQFQKKLEKVCETNFGVRLQKPNQNLNSFENQQELQSNLSAGILRPPLNNPADIPTSSLKQKNSSKKTNPMISSTDWEQKINETLNFKKITSKHEEILKIEKKQTTHCLNKKITHSVTLDSINLQTIEETKKAWNLKTLEEALNLLIQAGKKNLNRL